MRTLLFVVAMMMAGNTLAATSFPYEEVGVLDSAQGETKKAFMTRVGNGLLEFTERTGFEGCGVLQVKNGTNEMRLRVTTSRSHVACRRVGFREAGYTNTTEFIHSHPRTGKIVLSEQDARLIRRVPGETITVYASEFSEGDLRNGGGWLVVPKARWEAPQLLVRAKGMAMRVAKLEPVALPVAQEAGRGAFFMASDGEANAVVMAVPFK